MKNKFFIAIISLASIAECHAVSMPSNPTPAVRVSAMFDDLHSIYPYVTFVLPPAPGKTIRKRVEVNHRNSIDEEYKNFKDGDSIAFYISSEYGDNNTQYAACEGEIKLKNNNGHDLEAVQLKFTQISDGKGGKPPFYTCELLQKYNPSHQ
jgi:hypothetical protein